MPAGAPSTTSAPETAWSADSGQPILEVDGLTIHFPVGRTGFWGGTIQVVHAVENVSFSIAPGETLGLVGESGSGKTTVGRAVLRRITPTSGTIRFRGKDITPVTGEQLRQLRRSFPTGVFRL